MSVKLIVNVDNPGDLLSTSAYAAGALLRLERATLEAGPFAEIATTALVATQSQYELWDSTGSSGHFYRTRVSNAGNTITSAYSDVFLSGEIQAYATIDDLKETMNLPNADKDNALSDLLVDASGYIAAACKRDFYRHPQVSGTETRIYNVLNSGATSLSQAIGGPLDIISVSLLEATDTSGGTYTTIASGSAGYYLSPRTPSNGHPYEDILLSDAAARFRSFPDAYGAIQITGAFGWASVPPLIKRATIDLAREWYRQGPGGGGPIGMSALGQPQFQKGDPQSVQRAIALYRHWSFVVV